MQKGKRQSNGYSEKKDTNVSSKLYKADPWSPLIFLLLLAVVYMMSACYRYDPYNPYEFRDPDYPVLSPAFEDARVSCYWEPSINDYMWHFEAWVTYPRHDFIRIETVYAEVYHGPYIVDWFTLDHQKGKYWNRKVIERLFAGTDLHCDYYEDYEIDFLTFDMKNNSDIMTVWEVN